MRADHELAHPEAHRDAALAAPGGLEEKHRTPSLHELVDRVDRLGRREHAGLRCRFHGPQPQKKPSGFVL